MGLLCSRQVKALALEWPCAEVTESTGLSYRHEHGDSLYVGSWCRVL